MRNLMVENFVTEKGRKNKLVRIHFKNREPIKGLFIFMNDYQEMKAKNFWRIVSEVRAEDWLKKNDTSCSRLFSGDEFTRLTDL